MARAVRLEDVDCELAYRSLWHFVAQFWPIVESGEFVDGWHIRAICDTLEAVTTGRIKRLIINIPPRHMKSLLVAVFWPAWVWLRCPSKRFLYSSYAQTLSMRDAVRSRRLIQSPQYEALKVYVATKHAVPAWNLVGDQNTKIRYENSANGYRLATATGGALTGEGGDILVCDDPHNVIEAESPLIRQGVLTWFDESMRTRLSDPKDGAIVIIMQRVHQSDLVGHLLANDEGIGEWQHLCLPARYEGDEVSKVPTALDFADPRTELGEALWVERYSDEVLTKMESSVGAYAWAGQFQQRPSPRGGGKFKVDRLVVRQAEPPPSSFEWQVRYWDKAGTAGGGAYSCGLKLGKLKAPAAGSMPYLVVDVQRGQWSVGERESRIRQTAEMDGRDVRVWVEQEPGSGGKESAHSTIRNLIGYAVQADRVTDSKDVRSDAVAAQVEIGAVAVMVKAWTSAFTDELELFPVGTYRDQVDALSGAFNMGERLLSGKQAGAWGRRKH